MLISLLHLTCIRRCKSLILRVVYSPNFFLIENISSPFYSTIFFTTITTVCTLSLPVSLPASLSRFVCLSLSLYLSLSVSLPLSLPTSLPIGLPPFPSIEANCIFCVKCCSLPSCDAHTVFVALFPTLL